MDLTKTCRGRSRIVKTRSKKRDLELLSVRSFLEAHPNMNECKEEMSGAIK